MCMTTELLLTKRSTHYHIIVRSSNFLFQTQTPNTTTSLAFNLFMQDPNKSHTRKPWYQRAKEMSTLWRSITKSTEMPKKNNSITLWKTITKSREIPTSNNPRPDKLRKSTSLRIASSFTRVCLCAPISSSYTEVFRAELPPRRSNSYPRSKPFPTQHERTPIPVPIPIPNARHSTEGRKVFRGKSLMDDVLMRRFVVEEEAMMQVRRRNQMEVVMKTSLMRRKKLGPSPLSRMVMASEE